MHTGDYRVTDGWSLLHSAKFNDVIMMCADK